MQEIRTIKPTRVFFEVDKAYNEGYRIISEQGSTRSGKTYNTMFWICIQAWQHPGLMVSIVRATMPTLKKTVFRDFREVMRKLGFWQPQLMNNKDMEYRFTNGSIVTFFATEDEDKARGMKGNITFVNEATEISKPIFDQLNFRTSSTEDGTFHGVLILDYNPSFSNDHWISDLNNNPVYDKSRYFFKTTYKDNPYLSQDQIDAIEIYRETDHRMWRIYGLGEQCMAEGLIFDNYEVCDAIPDYLLPRAVLGIDWGYTDPFVIVLVGIDNRKRELYLKELCYKQHLSEDQIVREAQQPLCRGRITICDNSEPRTRNRLREAGLRIRNTKKQTRGRRQSIVPGIQVMKSYKIFITSDSYHGLIEADNYTWEKDRNGNWTDEPGKKFNHFWDAARYVVYTEGHSPGAGLRKGIRVVN